MSDKLKFIVLQGIQCAGKTTWAKEFLNEERSKTWIRVCRDDIRSMFGAYWVSKREENVTEVENFTVLNAMSNNKNIIIDATNLNPKTIEKWKSYVEEQNEHVMRLTDNQNNDDNLSEYEIEFKFFSITPEEAIERDSKRDRQVGKRVITDFWHKYVKGKYDTECYKRYYVKQDTKLPTCLIVDIDGTVALMNGRSPYDHSKVSEDLPNEPVICIVQEYAYNEYPTHIIFVSGRSDECKGSTVEWLYDHIFNIVGWPYPVGGWELHMRKADDWRKDAIVKTEIYNEFIKDKYNVKFVLDDRNQTVRAFRDLGLLCLQVYDGDF